MADPLRRRSQQEPVTIADRRSFPRLDNKTVGMRLETGDDYARYQRCERRRATSNPVDDSTSPATRSAEENSDVAAGNMEQRYTRSATHRDSNPQLRPRPQIPAPPTRRIIHRQPVPRFPTDNQRNPSTTMDGTVLQPGDRQHLQRPVRRQPSKYNNLENPTSRMEDLGGQPQRHHTRLAHSGAKTDARGQMLRDRRRMDIRPTADPRYRLVCWQHLSWTQRSHSTPRTQTTGTHTTATRHTLPRAYQERRSMERTHAQHLATSTHLRAPTYVQETEDIPRQHLATHLAPTTVHPHAHPH